MEIFESPMMFLNLLMKYVMMVDVLLEELKVIDELEKMLVDLLGLLER